MWWSGVTNQEVVKGTRLKENKEKTRKQTQQPSCSSHLNKGTENLKKQNTKGQEKKNEKNEHPLSPIHTLIYITRPRDISYLHIISSVVVWDREASRQLQDTNMFEDVKFNENILTGLVVRSNEIFSYFCSRKLISEKELKYFTYSFKIHLV